MESEEGAEPSFVGDAAWFSFADGTAPSFGNEEQMVECPFCQGALEFLATTFFGELCFKTVHLQLFAIIITVHSLVLYVIH